MHPSARLGAGTVVGPHALIGPDVRIGARPSLARTHLFLAQMLLARGVPGADARLQRVVSDGRDLARELGLERLAGRLAALLDPEAGP